LKKKVSNKNNLKSIKLSDYNLFRVAACSPELEVANPKFNTEKIIEILDNEEIQNSNFVLFPELSISSYTCADLFLDSNFLNVCLDNLLLITDYSVNYKGVIIVGCPLQKDAVLYNSAVVVQQGRILGIVPKTYLCNYGEFYEERWFTSGKRTCKDTIKLNGTDIPFGIDLLFENGKIKFGIEICEDLWAFKPPSIEQALSGANIIFNLSASNEVLAKYEYRKNLINTQSAKLICAYVYSSPGIGESTTDLVYGGHCQISQNGKILAENQRFSFESNFIIADIDLDIINSERLKYKTYAKDNRKEFREISFFCNPIITNNLNLNISSTPFIPSEENRKVACEEIINIQSSGLAKRLKHIKSNCAVIGLSGGLDSTLALLVTIKAFQKLNLDLLGIIAVVMPGPASSDRTQNNAKKLAENLGVTCKVINITEAVDVHLDLLEHNKKDYDITYENAQARKRTHILMDLANKNNGIVIGTGDLSELALGWCTYNGDQMSMYGVNSGVPKTLIKYLIQNFIREINSETINSILKNIVETPISPELIPDVEKMQDTEESVGAYILHDFFIYYFIKYKFSPKKLFLFANFVFSEDYEKKYIFQTLKTFFIRFFNNQFKRSVMPDGPKIGSINFSPRGDWRMPSDASKYLWLTQIDELEKNMEV
jgi:NAD+ synthase (glutamine-hydrolysing)